MAEPLKTFFDAARVARIGDEFASAWPVFPRDRFVREASAGLDGMELLDRGRHIAHVLARALPADYPAALPILLRAMGPAAPSPEGRGMEAFHHFPHTVFVQEHGLDHPAPSLAAMRELTSRSSCEFAIRPYLQRHEALALETLRAWTADPDEHVRRLVSEGTRPRLPWAPRLPRFQADPSPVVALLETLKDDPSSYVRRSVANNLNDISKDHPHLVVETCGAWLRGASEARAALVRHALRSLVRDGDVDAIRLLGGADGAPLRVAAKVRPTRPSIGAHVAFEVSITNPGAEPTTAVLSLRVHFVNARGGTSVRSFRLPTKRVEAGATIAVRKSVSLRQQTTRTHHPGVHKVDVVANGRPVRVGSFTLVA